MILIKKYKFHTALIVTSVLSIFAGLMTEKYIHNNTSHKSSNSEERLYDENLQFISPLLECDEQQAIELKSFKTDIENEIASLKKEHKIKDVAVYFRQLNDGYWFGINENTEFSPASLLKMPLMIAYLKEAEQNQKILTDTLTFTHNEDLYEKQNIKPEVTLEEGKQYSVKDLIGRMIIYSDNSAQALLMKNASYFWQ